MNPLQKNSKTILFLLALTAIILLFLYYKNFVSNSNNKADTIPTAKVKGINKQETEPFPLLTKYPQLNKKDYIRGNKDAQYELITYTDYECPYCKVWHEIVVSFLNNHEDLLFVYRQYPLEQLHSQAIDESVAAECVGKLGGSEAFWNFTDVVFQNTQSSDSLDLTQLPVYAEQAGIDLIAFNKCYNNKETQSIIDNSLKSASKYGIQGTPGSFLINTQSKKAINISGALPLEQLEEVFLKLK